MCCRAGGDLFVLRVDRPHKAIAAARQGLDPKLPSGCLAEHSPQRGNLDREIALLDGEPGPCSLNQRIFRYRDTALFYQNAQQPHGSPSQRDRLAATEKDRRLGIEAERAKGVTRQRRQF